MPRDMRTKLPNIPGITQETVQDALHETDPAQAPAEPRADTNERVSPKPQRPFLDSHQIWSPQHQRSRRHQRELTNESKRISGAIRRGKTYHRISRSMNFRQHKDLEESLLLDSHSHLDNENKS